LVSQEIGFLWNQHESGDVDTYPIRELAISPVIQRYFPNVDATTWFRGSELELIMLQWLGDLAAQRAVITGEPECSLAGTGLLEAIRGAHVLAPVTA
jgi:hypothetical protein